MNQDIKQKWVAALRSGEYAQGQNQLKEEWPEDDETNTHYCCLGVLCDLAVKAGAIESWDTIVTPSDIEPLPDPRDPVLMRDLLLTPEEVMQWAGLDLADPVVAGDGLSQLNDNGKSFSFIADLIETEL